MTNTAIAYIRVSTADQVDGHSLDNQISRISAYCTAHQLELVDVIRDEGVSGRKTNRPGFKMAMELVESKRINHVVVLAMSRFSRDTSDLLQATKIMKKNNVTFHSVSESINTQGAMGQVFLTILGAMDQFESERIGERTKSVKRFAKEAGRTYSSPIFGFNNKWDIDENGKRTNGRMEPNLEELKVVRYVYQMRSEKKSLDGIVQELKRIEAKTKTGKGWHKSTIEGLLRNDIYKKLNVI